MIFMMSWVGFYFEVSMSLFSVSCSKVVGEMFIVRYSLEGSVVVVMLRVFWKVVSFNFMSSPVLMVVLNYCFGFSTGSVIGNWVSVLVLMASLDLVLMIG